MIKMMDKLKGLDFGTQSLIRGPQKTKTETVQAVIADNNKDVKREEDPEDIDKECM